MPKRFDIYLNDGLIISLNCEYFTFDEEKFSFFGENNTEIQNLYISNDEVSAIVADEYTKYEYTERFHIYLQEYDKPIEVLANEYDMKDESKNVEFYRITYAGNRNKIQYLFVAKAAVRAILPVDKL